MKFPVPIGATSGAAKFVKKRLQVAGNEKIAADALANSRKGLYLALLVNGEQLSKAGRYSEAVEKFESILKEVPDHVDANYFMAQIATKLGATRNAIDHMRRALKAGAGRFHIQYLMAKAYLAHGMAEEAERHADLALQLDNSNEDALTLKAQTLLDLGKLEEAHMIAENLVQLNPTNDDAIGVYARSAKFNGREPEIAIVEEAYRSKPESDRLQYLGASLGKIFNDAKEYDKAFGYFKAAADTYEAGNALASMVARTQLMRDGFTEELISTKRKTGHHSRKPIFVVGVPRSGTTLTEQILASHPDVYGVGELKAMMRINAMISPKDDLNALYIDRVREIKKEKQFIFGENYLNTVYGFDKSSKHYVDKMPGNFIYIGLINIIFPNAKIIHCTRDPLDNCVSCYTSPLNDTHLYAKRLDTLGHYYREYRNLMQYWKSVSQIPIFDMPYERTVEDLEGSARALIAHVGLPWNDACLKFNEAKGRVATISQWQVRQPIYSTSVKRWKAYEKHLGPLIEALGDLAVTD